MKTLLLTMSATVLALTACDTVAPDRIDASRQYPEVKTSDRQATGTLFVGGLGPTNPRETSEGGKSSIPTMYSVYDGSGNLVTSSRASSVELPAGRYLIRPENMDSDERTPFWVTVEPGKQTVVDANQIQSEHSRMNVR